MGEHAKIHRAMPFTTVFRADAAEGAFDIGLQNHAVQLPWNGIDLAAQPRHPETMDDISACRIDLDCLAHRNVKHIMTAYTHAITVIGKLPPPHARRRGNRDVRLRGGRAKKLFTLNEGEAQKRHENGNGHDKPTPDDPLPGLNILNPERGKEHDAKQRHDKAENTGGTGQHRPP